MFRRMAASGQAGKDKENICCLGSDCLPVAAPNERVVAAVASTTSPGHFPPARVMSGARGSDFRSGQVASDASVGSGVRAWRNLLQTSTKENRHWQQVEQVQQSVGDESKKTRTRPAALQARETKKAMLQKTLDHAQMYTAQMQTMMESRQMEQSRVVDTELCEKITASTARGLALEDLGTLRVEGAEVPQEAESLAARSDLKAAKRQGMARSPEMDTKTVESQDAIQKMLDLEERVKALALQVEEQDSKGACKTKVLENIIRKFEEKEWRIAEQNTQLGAQASEMDKVLSEVRTGNLEFGSVKKRIIQHETFIDEQAFEMLSGKHKPQAACKRLEQLEEQVAEQAAHIEERVLAVGSMSSELESANRKVKEQEKTIASHVAVIEGQAAEIERLIYQLKSAESGLELQERKVSDQAASLSMQAKLADKQRSEIDHKFSEAQVALQRATELEEELAAQASQVEERDSQLACKTNEIADILQKLEGRDGRVTEQAAQLEAQAAEIFQSEALMVEQASEIDSRKCECEAACGRLGKLEAYIADQATEVGEDASAARSTSSALESANLRLKEQERAIASQTVKIEQQAAEIERQIHQFEAADAQSQELLLSLRQFKGENESLVLENRSLKDTVSLFEDDLERVSDRNAQLIGHVNQKQKIRYTLKLKDEKQQLRVELNRARARIAQLEGNKRCEGLFDALSSLGYCSGVMEHSPGAAPLTCSSSRAGLEPRTPIRNPPATPLTGLATAAAAGTGSTVVSRRPPATPTFLSPRRPTMASAAALHNVRGADHHEDEERLRPEEAVRRCLVQERALERVNADFQHLVSLVERAVFGDDPGNGTSVSGGSSSSCSHSAAASGSFAGLLQRLRCIISVQQRGGQSAQLPGAALERPHLPRENTETSAVGCARHDDTRPIVNDPRKNSRVEDDKLINVTEDIREECIKQVDETVDI